MQPFSPCCVVMKQELRCWRGVSTHAETRHL